MKRSIGSNASLRLIVGYFAFVLACDVVFVSEYLNPSIVLDLGLTRENGWGIVTSVFVHLSPSHLFNDASSIMVLSILLFFLANWRRESDSPTLAFLTIPFGSAIAANALYFFISPNPMAAGSSGVAYAMQGLALMYSAHSIIRVAGEARASDGTSRSAVRKAIRASSLYLAVFTALAFSIFSSPTAFLNVEPGVNYAIHGLAFIVAVFSTALHGATRRPGIIEEGSEEPTRPEAVKGFLKSLK